MLHMGQLPLRTQHSEILRVSFSMRGLHTAHIKHLELMQMQPLKPPVDRWVRAAQAAQDLGISSRVLQRSIEAGRADIRCARLGARGLLHLAAVDCREWAAQLAWRHQK